MRASFKNVGAKIKKDKRYSLKYYEYDAIKDGFTNQLRSIRMFWLDC
jgi:hypothetical protein